MKLYTACIFAILAVYTCGSPIHKRQAADWTWVDLTGGCIKNFNNRIIKSVESLESCKRLCELESNFECQSIDYNLGRKQCQLSEKYSGNNPISFPCHAGTQWSYAERQMQGSCQVGQVAFNSACYLIDTEKKNYENATKSCTAEGGHLVSILSVMENAFLAVELERTHTETKHTFFYIGLQAKNNEYTKWTDGNTVGYTNWGKDEPENAKEECVTIEKQEGYKWHDVTCSRAEASICKFDKKTEPGTIDISADDAYDLFVDGVQLGSGRSWKQAEHYKVEDPENVQVIAVKGMDTGKVTSGIILTFRYGNVLINTDSSWRCFYGTVDPSWTKPGYDDSTWPAAIEFSTNRDDTYVKTNNGKPWWPLVDKAAKMIWTKNSFRDTPIFCRKTFKEPVSTTVIQETTPELTTTAAVVIPEPVCQYIGQLLADKADPCRFYQCAYKDNNLNLRAVSMPCAPGTSVPPSYIAGNPCIGPPLEQCPKGTGI